MTEGVGAEPLEAKVARHQFVIQVVRTNPPFGTSLRSTRTFCATSYGWQAIFARFAERNKDLADCPSDTPIYNDCRNMFCVIPYTCDSVVSRQGCRSAPSR